MKISSLLSILLVCIIQCIFSFPANRLPKGAIIVAKDGSGKFRTVTFFFYYFFIFILKKYYNNKLKSLLCL